MATGLDGFAEVLKQAGSGEGDFVAKPYYEPETDSLIYYHRDVPSYSKRINQHFTLFVAQQDDSLVGFEVKGLNTILHAIENMGNVDLIRAVRVRHHDGKDYNLSIIMKVAALLPEEESPISGEQFDELRSATTGVRFRKGEVCGSS